MTVYARKNIVNLSEAELAKLIEGFEVLLKYPHNDYRGFLYWAGMHGYPMQRCQHGNRLFLPWHRAYVLALEKALQDVLGDYQFGLPYWDWNAPELEDAAIPEVLRTAPFDSITYTWGADNPRVTSRSGRGTSHSFFQLARQAITTAYERDEFDPSNRGDGFSLHCENGHNALHVWIGGDMSDQDWAAFDPIFWFHHCNVDRQWAVWQDMHPQADYSVLDGLAMTPFDIGASNTVNYRELGYEYVASESSSDINNEFSSLQSADPMTQQISVPARFRRAILSLGDVRHPDGSFELRVFVNDKTVTSQTSVDSNPHHGASYVIFSHDACVGSDPGHCSWRKPRRANDPRGQHHRKPFQLDFDLTDAIQRTGAGRDTMDVSILLVDVEGQPVPTNRFNCGNIRVRFVE